MRIGMMADVYKPHVSGITNYISLNKQFLEQAGHEVYVFTFGDENYDDDEEHIIRSPGLPLVDSGYYLSFRYNQKARHLLFTMDVVHVHHPFFSGALALRYLRPRGIPIVFTNHTRYDLYAQAYIPLLPETISETMLQAYLPPFCRACDLVIAPSEGLRQVLIRLGVNAEMKVIPNGVDLRPYQSEHPQLQRSQFGILPDEVILAYTGRLGPEKNLPFLMRSFAGAAQALPNVRLMLVGDGPERENLEDLVQNLGIEERVIFTGMIPYGEMPSYLSLADAFITASVTEVHPLSVIEAMAAGLPVLGIESPGVGDSVKNGQTGYLSSHDLAAYTAKMMRLISEHDLRQKMGEQAQQAAQAYDIQRTTLMMTEEYVRLRDEAKVRQKGLRYQFNRLVDRWRS